MRTLSATTHLVSALALALAMVVAALPANVPSSAIVVAKDGSGKFTTLQAAVNSVKQPNTAEVVIYVKAGTYTEQVSIKSDYITIVGDGYASTKITNKLDAKTWQSQNPGASGASAEAGTVKVQGAFFKAFDITFENTATASQAPAFYILGDNMYIENVQFLGWQDTLLSYQGTNQWFYNCYIRGDVDFIWGYGRAIFQNSEFHVGKRPSGSTGNGYIIANGNDGSSHKTSWFLMLDSSISADSGMSAWLGRPWGSAAAGTWQGVYMPSSVPAAGYQPMSSGTPSGTQYYEVIGTNTGPGSSTGNRVKWVHTTNTKSSFSSFFPSAPSWLTSPKKYGASVSKGSGYFSRCCQ
ncbi:carbohydrate esterase family 8 protein [Gonapodya prolifera JEL478]|uniref:pectinesterase n=1 Tax=Gonapodya prolifera (strain JEL478) TaxID=1344416 RepID=A0A138ZY46_GONPJ|nr:carbohydrate esterase family 8 protein [Gonapodya prolifera JEL478]|eukprot:KXS09417.1 carbohydrate esterase family 8 protein [Gonapodya prolifera JEL478]